jgi:hypothetical protein
VTFNPLTGLLGGQIAPGAAANGPTRVTVAASDGSNSVSQTFQWNVNP